MNLNCISFNINLEYLSTLPPDALISLITPSYESPNSLTSLIPSIEVRIAIYFIFLSLEIGFYKSFFSRFSILFNSTGFKRIIWNKPMDTGFAIIFFLLLFKWSK